ncbi:diacylglycerol/lipid kinase family protein, partial [Mesorhizobium sp. Cs1321R2N1]|uniref:diacylglycerol/lipid kinase family protein n=1 Tax=Mesorhizobium sp. Cs1321R2N1 TaxID=3015174 RepID=UPI003FA5DF2C
MAGLSGTDARSQGNSGANALDSLPRLSANEPTVPPCPADRRGFQCRLRSGPAKGPGPAGKRSGAACPAPSGGGCIVKVGVVLNPIAGGGRLKRHWPDVAAALKKHFGDFELRETQAEGDAERLALDLAANGFDLLIAAGGDGTAS